MKYVHKITGWIQQLDIFSSNIIVRFKADNDYKTLTSAIASFALIIYFLVLFIQNILTMIGRTEITYSILTENNPNPSLYNTSTSAFMFAIALEGINMNVGDRYFSISVFQKSIINDTQMDTQILLHPCSVSQWVQFGTSIQNLYHKLQLDQWLCPHDHNILLQGKETTDEFHYIQILVSNCSGIFNGQGCVNNTIINNYITEKDVFNFKFYFVNTILNPDNQIAVNQFLDDNNKIPFSIQLGTYCNFYLQEYTIETDLSLLPGSNIQYQTGNIMPTQIITNSFYTNVYNTKKPINFLKFNIQKSSIRQYLTRAFLKVDAVMSFLGGVIGLITMLVQIPLTYYNQVCYELSLATQLFHYKDQDLQKNEKQIHKIGRDRSIGTINKIEQQKQMQQLHSIDKFNFLKYLLLLPYMGIKKLGFKCKLKSMEPYYRALKETRKQNDILNMLKRLNYLDKVSDCLLDHHQKKLLHLFKKENIDEMKEQRAKFKLQKKLSTLLINKLTAEIFGLNLQPMQREATEYDRIKQSYDTIKARKDPVSRKILNSIDPEIIKQLESSDSVILDNKQSRGQLFDSPQKNVNNIQQSNNNLNEQQLRKSTDLRFRRSSNPMNLFHFLIDNPQNTNQKEGVQQHHL